jgi:hypothetical protein
MRVTIDYMIGGSTTTDVWEGSKTSVQIFPNGVAHVRVDDTTYMYAHAQRIIREKNVPA